MAKPPPTDPNHPRSTDPYATGRPAEPEKKSKVLPIVIGVIVLAILAYFLFGMSSEDEVETADPVAETQMDDTAVTTDPVVVDPVTPEVEETPDVTPTPDMDAAPATDIDADTTPALDTDADAAATDTVDDSVTVEIIEPDEAADPLDGAETTTVPLQSPETAPAN